MLPLFALFPTPPVFITVCETCTHPTLQSAVDAVSDGGTGVISLDAPLLDGATHIEGDKDIVLLPYLTPTELALVLAALQSEDFATAAEDLDGLEPVTLTVRATSGAPTIAVEGGSLSILGLAIDADLARGIDAHDTELNLIATTLFGRGFLADGGLVRVEGGSLRVTGGGFRDGSVSGQGGLVAVYDADVDITLAAFDDGAASYGGCLSVVATDPAQRHAVALQQVTFRACESSLRGGAVYLKGALDASISASSIFDSTSADGGGMALFGPDLVTTLEGTVIDGCIAFDEGGGIHADDAAVELRSSSIGRNTAMLGGGVAARNTTDLVLVDLVLEDNVAVFEGGGLHVQGGSYRASDAVIRRNVASGNGGGMWIGEDAHWDEDVRSTFCGNQGASGGGFRADLVEATRLTNVRLLDNVADTDGGGLFHSGEPLELAFANLLGNSAVRGSGAAAVTTDTLTLRDALVGYNLGAVAIVPRPNGTTMLSSATVWFGNERGDLDGLSPTEAGAIFADPLLDRYVAGDDCLLAQDWPTWGSPMRDAGTPGAYHLDLDGTRADVGAYGGPLADRALWDTDRDADGVPQIYDCDDSNPEVFPDQLDEPYDGIDADCRYDDDFDADRDGYRRLDDGGEDCDDTDADIHPGGDEDPSTLVDGDCDGLLDADGDGYVRGVLEGEDEPAELDCDDSNPLVYPGAPELGSDADYNCDGFYDGPRIYQLAGCASAPAAPRSAPWARRR